MGKPLAFHARVCYTCGEIKAGAMPVSSSVKGDTMSSYRITDDLYSSPLREAVLYQLSLRSFTEEGTLKAAEEKLPHIAALGVDMIYLTSLSKADPYPDPAYFSRRQTEAGTGNPKNPYRICDYEHVDPEYGTDDDLKDFIKKAHSLGLKVMHDLVYLHCGPGEFVEKHPAFVKRNDAGEVVYNSWHFPILNYENPALKEYLWDNMVYWATEFDFDGFRCDVGDCVPLDFWHEGIRRVRAVKPNFPMVLEGENPVYMVEDFDVAYSFGWADAIRNLIRGAWNHHYLRGAYEGGRAKHPDETLTLRLYENHDYVNDSYDDRLDKKYSERVDAAIVLNFTLDGVPLLYCGNELCDSRRHSIFSLPESGMSVDWSLAETEKGQARCALVRELCRLRHTEKVLTHGETVWEKDKDLIRITRTYGNETVCACFNFSGAAQITPCPTGEVLLSARTETRDGTLTLSDAGYYITKTQA